MTDSGVDVLCLTETWHEDVNDMPIRRLRSRGFQVLERARHAPATATAANTLHYTNHGGVAVVAPTSVRVAKLQPRFDPQTFELLCARITSCGSTCIVAVVYRPGSDDKTAAFYADLAKLLEYLSSFSSPFLITGDLNIRFDRPADSATIRTIDLLSSFGVAQCVTQPSHDRGGILDVVITTDDCAPAAINVSDAGLSDHRVVHWLFNLQLSSQPVYEERTRRVWRQFDLSDFRTALSSSSLCDTSIYTAQSDTNTLAGTYDATITRLLDLHAPKTTVRCRVRRRSDPWYDDCRATKRRARKLERRYRRWGSD